MIGNDYQRQCNASRNGKSQIPLLLSLFFLRRKLYLDFSFLLFWFKFLSPTLTLRATKIPQTLAYAAGFYCGENSRPSIRTLIPDPIPSSATRSPAAMWFARIASASVIGSAVEPVLPSHSTVW